MRPSLAVLALALAFPAAAGAQDHPTTARALIAANRVDVDSLLVEFCRGGTYSGATCRGATQAPRVTNGRRLTFRILARLARLDSLERVAPAPVPGPAPGPGCLALVNGVDVPAPCGSVPNIGWSITALYNAPTIGFAVTPTADTVSVCAYVERADGRAFVGYPVLRIRTVPDSVGFGVRFGNALASMCGPAVARAGKAWPTDSIAVQWAGDWVSLPTPAGGPRRVWRPFAFLPVP